MYFILILSNVSRIIWEQIDKSHHSYKTKMSLSVFLRSLYLVFCSKIIFLRIRVVFSVSTNRHGEILTCYSLWKMVKLLLSRFDYVSHLESCNVDMTWSEYVSLLHAFQREDRRALTQPVTLACSSVIMINTVYGKTINIPQIFFCYVQIPLLCKSIVI